MGINQAQNMGAREYNAPKTNYVLNGGQVNKRD